MVSSVVKVLSHLVILSSVLGHVSAEQRENWFVGTENNSLQPRDFLSSCDVWGTLGNENNTMAARCRSKTGSWAWSALDLNHCIVFIYKAGKRMSLIAQDDGNFFEFAQPCWSDNSTTSWAGYICEPEAENRGEVHYGLGIDLNKLVGNDNGTLVCGRQAFKGTMLSQEQVSWSTDGIEISQGQ